MHETTKDMDIPTSSLKFLKHTRCQFKKSCKQTMGTSLPSYGTAAPCPPMKHPLAKNGTIAWSWFPAFSWLKILVTMSFVLVLIGVIVAVFRVIIGIVIILFGVVGFVFFLNWKWNADKQLAYQLARGKSVQARELWVAVDEMFHYQAKDTFFETRYGGKTLQVLRDGSVEVHGNHDDDVDTISGAAKVAGNGAMEVSSGDF